MCLLVVDWRPTEPWPLVVGSNRDEWLDRPATAMTVLRDEGPRILGGRDERAGGTWMAVNAHGVVCGLTNRPLPDGPDPDRRSRGRLPLLAATARSAAEAADVLAGEVAANAYNPAWLLVGDRQSLHYLAVGPGEPATPQQLTPGLHVLENASLGVPSAKVDHVRAALGAACAPGRSLWQALPSALADHGIPAAPSGVHRFPDGRERLEATMAACVHADGYGTRWSATVRVSQRSDVPPDLRIADGPPCVTPFASVSRLWSDGG